MQAMRRSAQLLGRGGGGGRVKEGLGLEWGSRHIRTKPKLPVILAKEVDGLGQTGEVVQVKHGYARNFLIPNRLAIYATKDNLSDFSQATKAEMGEKELAMTRQRARAVKVLRRLEAGVDIKRALTDDGKLYGSVTAANVVEAVRKQLAVDLAEAALDFPPAPIKDAGDYYIKLRVDLGEDGEDYTLPVRIARR